MRTLGEFLQSADFFITSVGPAFHGFEFGSGEQAKVSAGKFHLFLSHLRSALLLLQTPQLRPTAFALVRCIDEEAIGCMFTFIPGCTTDKQMRKFQNSDKEPFGDSSRMLGTLRKKLTHDPRFEGTGIEGLFRETDQPANKKKFNGFLHGGMEQITRFGDENGWMTANHSDADCTLLVVGLCMNFWQVLCVLFVSTDQPDKAESIARAFVENFPPSEWQS